MTLPLKCLPRLLSKTSEMAISSTRNYVRRARRSTSNANAGLDYQLKLLNEKEKIDVDDPDLDFDEHESDFYGVGASYTDFKKDMSDYKEKEKHWIVKRKYFKEVTPNFLTWSEKEQIKNLHQSDPVAYSVERLAEIFPATVGIVHRIIKSKWKVGDPARILNHDKTVEMNWKLLKEDKISVDERYKEHLEKFSSRDVIVLDENNYMPKRIMDVQSKPTFTTTSKQFSSIIQSYNEQIEQKQIESGSDHITEFKKSNKPLLETYVIGSEKKSSNKPQVFSTFKKEMGDIQSETVKTNQSDVTNKQIFVQETPVPIFGKKYQENSISNVKKTLPPPNKINIPKKLWKSGQTYKVNDCFYDDDGRFLYRVPGLE